MKATEQQEEFWIRHLTENGYHLSDSSEYKAAIQEIVDRIFSLKSLDHDNMFIVHRNLVYLCEELGGELPELAQKWKSVNIN